MPAGMPAPTRPRPFFKRAKRVRANLRYRAENLSPARQKLRVKRVGPTGSARFATPTYEYNMKHSDN
jgi:hypothetical protein